jgi:hypothetical protein
MKMKVKYIHDILIINIFFLKHINIYCKSMNKNFIKI